MSALVQGPDQAALGSQPAADNPVQAGLLPSVHLIIILTAVAIRCGTEQSIAATGTTAGGGGATQEPDRAGGGYRALLMSEAERDNDFQIYEEEEDEDQGDKGGPGEAAPTENGAAVAGETQQCLGSATTACMLAGWVAVMARHHVGTVSV